MYYNLGDKIVKKVTISIPEAMLEDVNKEIERKKFSSLSEFIRHAIRRYFEEEKVKK